MPHQSPFPCMNGIPRMRLDRLDTGDRYFVYEQLPYPPHQYMQSGTVLWVGSGSVEVLLDGDKNEDDSVRWAPETEVYKLVGPELEHQLKLEIDMAVAQAKAKQVVKKAQESTLNPTPPPTPPTPISTALNVALSPQAKALVARWNFNQKQLNDALASDDSDKIETITVTMEDIKAKAVGLGYDIEQLASGGAQVRTDGPGAPGGPPAPKAKTKAQQDDERMSKRNEAIQAHKVAQGGKAKAKKEKRLRPCLDGCGTMTPSNFTMGHDAKLKSLIIKIERGEVDRGEIPEIAQDLVKFTNGELEVEKDANGKVVSKTQHLICTAAPVRFPGRDDMELTVRED